MRFLRMLTNALLAGALGAAYLTILLLQLNPQVPLLSQGVWRWFATLAGRTSWPVEQPGCVAD